MVEQLVYSLPLVACLFDRLLDEKAGAKTNRRTIENPAIWAEFEKAFSLFTSNRSSEPSDSTRAGRAMLKSSSRRR
ncbi:hypothetical protein [Caballeronia zhejiangensis]|uniref:hypothetical protein n=1 Tax=Caballeronia zhejiangensis TaxID=871203 RepID=UPI001F5198B3|nr:hypothetical protein [Caballeronia zhejiangensis]MCI1047816.1 hypothetical protein [Caballeronia zhejiangensis]